MHPAITHTSEESPDRVNWERGSVCDLIRAYRKHPGLYDTSNPYYNSHPKRQAAYQAIRFELLRKMRKITVENIRKKIHVVRTKYWADVAKIRSEKTALKPGDVYRPTWWFFAEMDFLRHVKIPNDKRRQKSVLPELRNDVADSDHSSQLYQILHSPPAHRQEMFPDYKYMPYTPNFYVDTYINEGSMSPNHAPDECKAEGIEDDLSAFCRLVELELRKINDAEAVRAVKKAIFNAIIDVQHKSTA